MSWAAHCCNALVIEYSSLLKVAQVCEDISNVAQNVAVTAVLIQRLGQLQAVLQRSNG